MLLDRAISAARRAAWKATVSYEMLKERSAAGDAYLRRVRALHRLLGIPEDYPSRGLTIHREASELLSMACGRDGRVRWMTPRTRACWTALSASAAGAGVTITVRYAFRSIDEQAQLIRQELAVGGQSIDALMSWIAAPGYSEHHTGRALDLETDTDETCHFEQTPAYEWLLGHAAQFGFHMTYPEGNRYGIIFEPWHWCCSEG